MLPIDHVAPDPLTEILVDTCAALRANTAYLELSSDQRVKDTPADPMDPRDGASLELFLTGEAQSLERSGLRRADQAEGSIGIIVKVAERGAWEATLRQLRARVRAVLLQDSGYPHRDLITRIDEGHSLDETGARVVGVVAMTVSFEYQVLYPPPDGVPVQGADIDVDVLGADGAPDGVIDGRIVLNFEDPA